MSDPTGMTGASFPGTDRRGSRARLFWDGEVAPPDGWIDADRSTVSELLDLGLDVESASIDQVYVGPVLGRIDGWRIVPVLEEFRRVLIPGGTIRVAVLDAHRVIRAYQIGDRAFFWDDPTDDLAGALAAQLLEWGAARTTFTPTLIGEHLSSAGFEAVRPSGFGESPTAQDLASADRLGDRLCYTEAVNPAPWPGAPMPDGPQGIHLGWGDDRCATVSVTWSARPSSEWTLRYRSIGESTGSVVEPESWPTIDGSLAPHVFHARCTDLAPGGDYEYEVVPSEGNSQAGFGPVRFSTLPPEPEGVTFAFFGDTGLGDRPDGLCDGVEAIHEVIERARPHFVLGGGDYAYKSSDPRVGTGQQAVQAWLDQVSPIAACRPLLPQWGNHDVDLAEFARDWTVHFPPPATGRPDRGRCYSFDARSCHVTAFYAPTPEIDPADVSWLWADLSAARARGCRWLVVYQHQPLFAHGTSHRSDPRVAQALHRVLDHHRVDLHLSAHDQNYERTYPLAWAGQEPVACSADAEVYRRGEGTVYAKVSPGGKMSDIGGTFSSLGSVESELIAWSSDDAHHVGIVRYDESELDLTVYGATSTSPSQSPCVVDHVVITDAI